MATVLNIHPSILTIGEMHQFLDYYTKNQPCSCGKTLRQCEIWHKVIESDHFPHGDLETERRYSNSKERHRNIPGLMFSGSENRRYLEIHESIFDSISYSTDEDYYLDSSKYLARYLLLSKSKKINVKGVFVVRDIRGVIHSFAKKVQTPRPAWSAIIYYWAVNVLGLIIALTDKRVIKIKYEDFVENPEKEMGRIFDHVFEKNEIEVTLQGNINMPHIIGGNRMKSQSQININRDMAWKSSMSKIKQVTYYVLALPLMLLNGYRI